MFLNGNVRVSFNSSLPVIVAASDLGLHCFQVLQINLFTLHVTIIVRLTINNRYLDFV